MNGSAVLRWTARRLPGVPADVRDDVVEAIDEISDEAPCTDCALEVGSLVGFALRTASRRGAADDRHEMIRQGAWVGALVLAIAAAMLSWAGAGRPDDVIVAVLATLLAGVMAGGYRPGAIAIGAAATVVAAASGDGRLTLAVIGLGAVVFGRPFDARPCPVGACLAIAGTLGGGAIAGLLPGGAAEGALIVTATAVAVVLLAVGWFDPRYAVAATVVWFWRFAETDVSDVAAAFGALDHVTARLVIVRWVAMGAGVLVAWHVADAAMQRCLTVFRRR